MIISLKFTKLLVFFPPNFQKKQFHSQNHAYNAQLEALSFVKKENENVRHYASKFGSLVKQGWYNEFFTRGLHKKVIDFAKKRQIKHISSSFEPFIPFHSLVNMVDSEDNKLEKIKTQEHSLEINTLFDTFNQNATVTDTSTETPQLQPVDPNYKSEPQFKKYCSSS